MPAPAALAPRIKAHLRLAINRLKLVQEKNTAIAKQSRRQMAQLMEQGKIASAKIRVENIIQEDINVELLEALELYSEVCLARSSMIERYEKDARLQEALYVLIYAAPHVDIKELLSLRELLAVVLPKEFMVDALENTSELVPQKVLSKIHPEVPSEELVNLYLQEIARAYRISVPGIYEPEPEPEKEKPEEARESTPTAGASSGAPSGAAKPAGGPAGGPAGAPPAADDLQARFAALRK